MRCQFLLTSFSGGYDGVSPMMGKRLSRLGWFRTLVVDSISARTYELLPTRCIAAFAISIAHAGTYLSTASAAILLKAFHALARPCH
jgi:hypothetical protein